MSISNGMTRRSMLTGGTAASLVPLVGSSTAAHATTCSVAPTPAPNPTRPERAISLRVLSAALEEGKPGNLGGMTRLDGYAIDEEHRDVVLFGASERGQPELQAADFIVGLRSAFSIDEVYRKRAAVSIDPDPEHDMRLRDLDVINKPEERRRYKELCHAPGWRHVRVDGMPRHSRVAKVLVDADVRMKQVAMGLVKLPLPNPLLAPFDARFAARQEAYFSGVDLSHRESLIRFWFTPRRFSHLEAPDRKTARIEYAQVMLKDQELDPRSGNLEIRGEATQGGNPEARAFACAWTERMEEISGTEPLWREMHNMYRHFALGRIMFDLDAFKIAAFDAEFLIDRYELPRVAVPATVIEGSRIESLMLRDRGRGAVRVAMWACGGVHVGFKHPLESLSDANGELPLVSRSALATRSSSPVKY